MKPIESVLATTSPFEDTFSSAGWKLRFRSQALLEVAIAFGLILLVLWSERPTQTIVGLLTFFWILVSTLRSHRNAESLGLRLSGLRRSLWIVGTAGLAAAGLLWIASQVHTLHIVGVGHSVEASIVAYMLWALVQQFILQDFFLPRMLRILPSRTAAVIVTGALFAVAHIPNPLLMIATLVWGIVACALFLRYRNLYSLGIAHGILGLCLAISIPTAIHHQMRVGIGYLR